MERGWRRVGVRWDGRLFLKAISEVPCIGSMFWGLLGPG